MTFTLESESALFKYGYTFKEFDTTQFQKSHANIHQIKQKQKNNKKKKNSYAFKLAYYF